jgi:hypothetical protein
VDDLKNHGNRLPWIYPEFNYFLGGSSNSISFSVPEIGSKVEVFFPFNDIYLGFYRGHWATLNIPSEFSEDYPESFGWKDSTGTYFRVNKTQQYLELFHVSGTRVRIYDDGKVETYTYEIDHMSSGNASAEIEGDVRLQIGGSFNIDAIETNINNLIVGNGATGVFTSLSGQVVTVQDGIVIGIV